MAKRFIILIAILLAAAASVIACAPANIKDVPEVSDGPDAGILPDNEDSFSSVTTKPGKEVMRTPDITTKPDEETTRTPATTPSTGEQTTPEKIDWRQFRKTDCSCSIFDVTIKSDGTLVPPGTLDKVEDIPDADMSDVGKTVSNILVPSCKYAYISAAYYYNAENAKERLVTIEVHPDSQVSLLSVYETDFGGPRGFYSAVEKGKVDAKLTGRCYISFIEAIRENTPGFYHYDGKLATADSVGGDLVVATVRIFEGKREFRVMNADDEIATTPISELYEIIYERFDQRFGLKALVAVK